MKETFEAKRNKKVIVVHFKEEPELMLANMNSIYVNLFASRY
jgi:murein L,D-transpeptidase YafK